MFHVLHISSLTLERWSCAHAAAMLVASAAAIGIGHPWPVGVLGALSLAALLAANRRFLRGPLLAPNAVTSLRVLLVAAAAVSLHGASSALFASFMVAVFALDGLDGWLARMAAASSEFGAHFDMETDALFVLVVTIELWASGRFGPWILVSGVLRYAYVLCLALVPARSGAMPRSRWARYAFAVLVAGLVLGVLLPAPFAAPAAFLGSVAVWLSFMRSFYWSYRAV